MSANDRQVAGNHYKTTGYQPWDFYERWNCGVLESNIIKYVTRARKKSGRQDLEKALHYAEKLLEVHTNPASIGRKGRGNKTIRDLKGNASRLAQDLSRFADDNGLSTEERYTINLALVWSNENDVKELIDSCRHLVETAG